MRCEGNTDPFTDRYCVRMYRHLRGILRPEYHGTGLEDIAETIR